NGVARITDQAFCNTTAGLRRREATMFYGSWLWLVFAIPPMILALWAQWRLKNVFGKYSQVRTQQGLSGARAARLLLDSQGLQHVPIRELPSGNPLDNHYDPRDRTLNLSPEVYRSESVAAVGV